MNHIILFILLVSFSAVATKQCSQECVEQAGDSVMIIGSWEELKKHHGKYHVCDDGYIAEGYSEVVSILLADNWLDLDVGKWSPNFKQFVVKHIDETWGISNYQKAYVNAKTQCSTELNDICLAIMSLPKGSFNQQP